MAEPRYVVHVWSAGVRTSYTQPLPDRSAAYLAETVRPALVPLADDDYLSGPAAILSTPARSSYVLLDDEVLWCVERVMG